MLKKSFTTDNINWIIWRGAFWEAGACDYFIFAWGAANMVMENPETEKYVVLAMIFFCYCFYLAHRICYRLRKKMDPLLGKGLRIVLRVFLVVGFIPLMISLIHILTPYRWMNAVDKYWFYQTFIQWWI